MTSRVSMGVTVPSNVQKSSRRVTGVTEVHQDPSNFYEARLFKWTSQGADVMNSGLSVWHQRDPVAAVPWFTDRRVNPRI